MYENSNKVWAVLDNCNNQKTIREIASEINLSYPQVYVVLKTFNKYGIVVKTYDDEKGASKYGKSNTDLRKLIDENVNQRTNVIDIIHSINIDKSFNNKFELHPTNDSEISKKGFTLIAEILEVIGNDISAIKEKIGI